tara:strand:+ start:8965 stop:10536 length:1572 start_codon:yes stop_codon:yes gene_type:complete
MKNNTKLLITTRADAGIKEMTDITHPIIKKYAEKVGADFMVLSHVPPSDSGDGRPHYRILKHYELHEKYDRILHIDSDMIIMPNCPNLFEVVPYDKIGTVLEDKGSRKPARHNLIQSAQDKFGHIGWNSEYINTGIILTSKCHRDIFQAIDGEYWTGFGSDDVQLGYLIKKNGFEIMDLPFQYNHMTMFSEPWNGSPNRFKSNIIHYGGRGVFDENVKTKMDQIRKDYDRIYGDNMRILFVGVFDTSKKSTNTSQLLAFKRLGHTVVGYNYRSRAKSMGNSQRDLHLLQTVEEGDFDLVVFSKCDSVSVECFQKIKPLTKTCLWFMDPLVTYNEDMRLKTAEVTYFCCDKRNVLDEAKKINKNSFHVCEGYDQDVDKPHSLEKEHDISFIGNIYGDRQKIIENLNHDVHIFSNAYGAEHAKIVSKSWINLNFCTSEGASDRVYKILAAGGFLLTNDWDGRDKYFVDNEDLMIFSDINDLNDKISKCLKNKMVLNKISESGKRKVNQFNRLNWAKKVVNICNEQ